MKELEEAREKILHMPMISVENLTTGGLMHRMTVLNHRGEILTELLMGFTPPSGFEDEFNRQLEEEYNRRSNEESERQFNNEFDNFEDEFSSSGEIPDNNFNPQAQNEFHRQFKEEYQRQYEKQMGSGFDQDGNQGYSNDYDGTIDHDQFTPPQPPEKNRPFTDHGRGNLPPEGFAPPQEFRNELNHEGFPPPLPPQEIAPERTSLNDNSSFLGNVINAFMSLFR